MRETLEREIAALGSTEKGANTARFFKTNAGEYGEGDVFIGITMPELRRVVARYVGLSLSEVEQLLQ